MFGARVAQYADPDGLVFSVGEQRGTCGRGAQPRDRPKGNEPLENVVANSQDGSAGEANAERAAVARTTARLLSAVNAADLAGVLADWSDDGVLMPPHHPSVRGRSAVERYFSQLFEQIRFTFSFTSSQIHVSGDTAFERVEYAASARPTHGGSEVQDVGKGLHVYRREPTGAWKLAMDIWNSDTPVTAEPSGRRR